MLDSGPLISRHRSCARVGQQIDQYVVGVEAEEVPANLFDRAQPFGTRGEPDGLDGVNSERLDDGAEGHGRARCTTVMPIRPNALGRTGAAIRSDIRPEKCVSVKPVARVHRLVAADAQRLHNDLSAQRQRDRIDFAHPEKQPAIDVRPGD